jgi:phage terminase large subunit
MAFIYTTAIKKLRALSKRVKVVPGGTSAGKTYGIIPILIDTACRNPREEISIVSESIPHLRRGALKDFINIMKDTGRYIDSHFNRTLLTYTFSNDSYIEFFSADQEDRVRGPRRKRLYMNEANNLTFETYHQLAIRTEKEIWIDFNPSNEFWAHKELSNDPDCDWLTLTYKDNEGLSDNIVKEIEKARDKAETSKYWASWWKVYGLGQLGVLEGVIFDNWSVVDSIPANAKLIGYGMDFGYTNDPTTLIACYELDGKRYFDEEIYMKGLSNSELANLMKSLNKEWTYADSADPKSIDELYSYGIKIKGATKGKDSINFGVSILQESHFYVTARSLNMIKELRNYCWDTDREGNKLNKPVDAYNHSIDAMRYLAMERLSMSMKPHKPRVTFGKFSR